MIPRVSDYIGRRRDSVWERELAKQLRQAPEPDRLDFIVGMLAGNEIVGLDLARKCLADRASFKKILELGLIRANPSTIRDWLKAVVHALGERRLMALLEHHRRQYPLAVSNAFYWFPNLDFLPPDYHRRHPPQENTNDPD